MSIDANPDMMKARCRCEAWSPSIASVSRPQWTSTRKPLDHRRGQPAESLTGLPQGSRLRRFPGESL